MARKREICEQLTRTELLAVVEAAELEVADKRVVKNLVEAVAGARKVDIEAIVGDLPRDRLKDLCRALGLDDSGREKSALVDRLAGRADGALVDSGKPANERADKATGLKAQRAKRNTGDTDANGANGDGGRGRKAGKGKAADVEVPTGVLTREQLERYLWAAADILRGSIDSSDYKNFIFGLLFLKRLSDRFDEECDALVAEGIEPESRDEHQFFVPKGARWASIARTATNIGETLNKACAALENDNNSLQGVLAGIDYNDERKLGDGKARDTVLGRLVQHFSALNLRNSNLSEPDLLGRAYEYLIEQFADDAGKKGGEFYTPRGVVQLIVELLAPKPGMRICDPTCGSGGMLIECAHYVERHAERHGKAKSAARNLSLFGQEKNLGTWAICKMNMLLHGLPDARIEKGDTIRDPKLVEQGALMVFDRVIANPPFSLDEWGIETASDDGFGRFRFGMPPKSKGDLAFVQHMLATLNVHGQLGVVMPHGVLFRGGSEGEIRKGIIEEDLLEAVIGLPPNLFYGTGIPAAVLVMNREKAPARKGKVLFIEASREFKEGSAQNYLRTEDVNKIAKAFHAFEDVERYARVVPVAELTKNDCNLNISRYVETAEAAEKIDVAGAIAKLRELEAARAAAEATMNRYLKELGYDA